MLSKNKFSKEAIPIIFEFLADNSDKTLEEVITELNLKPMSIEELENVVDKVIAQHSNPKKLKHPFRVIMAEVMKIAQNRINGKLVREVINEKLKKYIKH